MDFPVLNGPRISLRRVEAESPVDVESMYRCYQCPEAHRYMQGRACRREEWPEIIRDWEKERREGRLIRWGIALKGNGALIGGIYLYREEEQLFVGYMLHPANWGEGYAYEALAAVLEYVRAVRAADTLYAPVDKRNSASIRLLEKSGFRCFKCKAKEKIYARNIL